MFKKQLLFFLIFSVTIVSLFASGEQAAAGGTQGSGPVKLTVAITEDLRIQDYETNGMTRILEQSANVDLEFTLFPSVDYLNKLNLMVMAGGSELADIIIARPNDAMIYQWGLEGAIIPLTKYYDNPQMSPYIQDTIKRTGVDFIPQIASPNGEIYGVPQLNMSYGNEYPDKIWYYEPWLTQLGLKMPETTEDLRNVFRAVVKGDPNGNGRADEQGITGLPPMVDWFRYMMNSFVYAGQANQIVVENGKLSIAYNTPQWREGLKFIRSLFQEGLIPTENLTQDRTQANTVLNSPEVRSFSFIYTTQSQVSTSTPAGDKYIPGMPVRGPAGTRYSTYTPSTAAIEFMISSNCKNPDAAFRVGDLMLREDIGIIQRCGQEGLDWDYARNVKNRDDYVAFQSADPLFLVMYADHTFWGGSAVANSSWRQKGPYARSYAILNGRGMLKSNPNVRDIYISQADAMYQKGGWNPREVIPKLIYTVEENSSIGELQTALDNYVKEMTSAFLAGNRDIDASWNAYVMELNTIGLERYLSINQTVYDRMYK